MENPNFGGFVGLGFGILGSEGPILGGVTYPGVGGAAVVGSQRRLASMGGNLG